MFKTQLVVDRIARSRGVDPINYWKEITEHVESMGGTHLDFICWDERSDAVICRLRWAGERLATNERRTSDDEPAWQFNYSVPGRNGVRATLTSRGNPQNRLKGQRLIDLFRLFDTFCHSWTAIALPRQSATAESRASAGANEPMSPTILTMPSPIAVPADASLLAAPDKVTTRRAA